MIKSRKLRDQLQSTESIDSITHILENIASIRIGQIKDEVLGSREFFQRLWAIFSQLRVSSKDLASQNRQPKNSKPAVVLVTANAGLTGEVDTKLITRVLSEVDPKATDFYVYGLHGEGLLLQRLIKPVKTFRFPEVGTPIDVTECAEALSQYQKPIVYFPSYSALTVQDISKIELVDAVQAISSGHEKVENEQLIYEDNTIFEPSVAEVVSYLERMMIGTILTEIILESNLAQYASRFNAMTAASSRAETTTRLLRRQYLRAKRYESDEANRRFSKHRKVAV